MLPMPPRPLLQAVAPHHTAGRLKDLVPASVLIVGLGAVAAIVATARLSPSELRERSGITAELNPVGGGAEVYPSQPISPFSHDLAHRPWLLTIMLTLLYLGSATAIGSIIVNEVRGNDIWPRPLAVIAGFLPGYLMLLAPLQLLFAAVPFQTASWIALIALPTSALALHWRTCSTSAAAVAHDRRALRKLALTACGIAAITGLALVHRLQVSSFYLTQDSIQWLLSGATAQLRDPTLGPYLLQWNIQSDEWVFNAPLMFSSHNIGDLWFPFYATQCVSLASLLALVFGIVHRLARRRKSLAAGLTVATVFGSTLAIYPWIYAAIVLGGQPVVQLAHPGRHVGVVAPWIALLLLGRQRRGVIIALAFATLGLGFVSLHVLLNVLAALIAALIYRAVRGTRPTWMNVRGLRIAGYLLPVVAWGAITAAFWVRHAQPPTSAAWWLVLGQMVAIGGAFAIGAATVRRSAPASHKLAPVWIGAWLAALAAGLVLSNNLTGGLLHGHARSLLGSVLPGYHGPLVGRGFGNVELDVLDGLSFPKLSVNACQSVIVCGGVADFLATFGVLFVLILVTWISFGPFTSDAVLNARRAALLMMVAGIGLGLTIVFFVGAPSFAQTMIYTRFLEIPYYGLLGLATMTLVESRNRITAIAGTTMLVLWTVTPLIASEWPQQMARNAGWYLHYIF
jgi:hypothetical protein